MFVKEAQDQTLIKIADAADLFNPVQETVQGQRQAGEEEQPLQTFKKSQLVFPSGESLPQCWLDPNYQLKQA
ncbi:MAG: acetyltransferase [Cyanobacteria bacterium P01_D01_bin.128]